jgi:hypothetical protein
MKVLTAGASATNEGTITATATTDSTVTAQINPSEGQTQMAIYGVPSTKVAYVSRYYGSVNKATGAVVEVNFSLVVNEDSATDVDLYIVKSTLGAQSTGSNSFIQSFDPYLRFPGPCILKMQGIASAADTEASAGFDLYLADA